MESTAFPWIKHLSEDEQHEFYKDMAAAFWRARDKIAAGSVVTDHDYAREIDQIIHEWKVTAEVWSDPETIQALLTTTMEDLGPVPRPEIPEENT